MNLFIRLLSSSLAVGVTAYLLPGIFIDTGVAIVATVVVLGVVNTFLKPLLILFTLPINILTLGLFTFIINAFLVMLTGIIVPGFHVESFFWALLFSVVMSVVNSFLLLMFRDA